MTFRMHPSRRSFLQGGVAGFAITAMPDPLWSQVQTRLEDYATQYFTPEEWVFVMAATARLIPSDTDGPGALEARVPVFIDLQLAGRFGQAADWYMAGPHDPSADADFGYQSPLTPAEIYRQAIPLFDAWCERRHGGRFADLSPDLQDTALTALEEDSERRGDGLGPAAGEGEESTDGPASESEDEGGEEDEEAGENEDEGNALTDSPGLTDSPDSPGATDQASAEPSPERLLPDQLREFFPLLLQNTKEGYFADPQYGGNHGMAGWLHIGFPGARASYLEWVDRDNVPYRLGPVSITGERA
jgi:gluconate 2-dehydrogenase gamma chain